MCVTEKWPPFQFYHYAHNLKVIQESMAYSKRQHLKHQPIPQISGLGSSTKSHILSHYILDPITYKYLPLYSACLLCFHAIPYKQYLYHNSIMVPLKRNVTGVQAIKKLAN